MRTLRLVFLGGVISYRALFNWTTPALFAGSLLAGPLFQTVFFVFLGRRAGVADDSFYVLGNALLATTGACIFGGTMAVANERRFGTLEAILLSPRNRLALWGGRAIPYVVNGLVVGVFNLVVSAALLGVDVPPSSWYLVLLALGTAVLSGSAFGFVIGAIGLRARNTMLTANLANAVLILMTGAVVPRARLTPWLDTLGNVLPLTHAVVAIQAGAHAGGAGEALSAAGLELAVGAGYAVVAAVLLALFERASVRGGALTTV